EWWQAGLFGSPGGQSAILWAQNTNQCMGPNPGQCVPNWSWQDVRASYREALTKVQKDDRDAAFAKTFEGLGRQIHVVQDAASPGHARVDPHPTYNFERFVRDAQQNEVSEFNSWLT